MKTKLLIGYLFYFLTIFSPEEGMSQGEFNNWYFGFRAAVTFNSGVPVSFLSSVMAASGGTVNVSDSVGNIWFYCNVTAVYNKNNVAMPNGWPLYAYGGGFNQPVLAVQKPSDDSTYYLFLGGQVTSLPSTTYSPMWSIINMRLDGGLGDIQPGFKNIPLNGALKAWNAVTGIRHKNNHDAWVVVRLCDTDSNYFASYLISNTGLNTTPIYSISQTYTNSNPVPFETKAHQIKISPDGNKLVCLYATDTLEFCNFVPDSGKVHSLFTFKPKFNGDSIIFQNVEFSNDSKLLYISGKLSSPPWSTIILQFNSSLTDSALFMKSQTKIGLSSRNQALQMAVDGKIYCSPNSIDSLSVINYPSVQGVGCGFQENVVYLKGRQSGNGLPQFVQKYKAFIHHTGNCQNSSIHFSGDIWPPPDSIHWNFGDPASGASNFSNLSNPEHIYSIAGTYTVELFVRHIDNRTDTSWQTITILAGPQPSFGPERTICVGNSTTFDAGPCTGCSYEWKDINSGLTVGTNQTYTTNLAGNYCVIVTNPNGCIGSDTVLLLTIPVPQLTNSPLYDSICSGQTTNIPLSSNVSGTMFHWTTTLTSGSIAGFSADSGLIISQTLVNTGLAPGIVTYHITPKIGSCSGVTVDFPVTVNIGDSVKVSVTASQNNICAGTPVNFNAFPTNPGITPFYQWKVNGGNVGTNSSFFSYTPADGDQVTCVLTSSETICVSNNPATSNTITMVVHPLLPVSTTISTPQTTVCAGTSVTFTATPIHGGLTPTYQWKVNGVNTGTNNQFFTCIPITNDIVTCIMTSSDTCVTGNPATSNPITMTVNPVLSVSVTITASNNPVCGGIPVTFTATPNNGGTPPVYQWTVNGLNVGPDNYSYTYSPVNGDVVRCTLTSNIACPIGNPANSNVIVMTISPTPVVSFPACFDTITSTSARPIQLKGAIPLGGTYSGPGVNPVTGTFTPSLAGIGTKTISYSYTNVGLCTANKSRNIIVQGTPVFACNNNFTDIRDNKVYQTIQIGGQCWFASDLNYGVMISSTQNQRDNCLPEKYLNSTSFYQWDELMLYNDTPGLQGLCPPGWHVPTENDWNILFGNYLSNAFAGSPLKYSGYSGFNALLTGANHMNVQWDYQNFAVFYWSSTAHGTYKAWAHGMNDFDPSVSYYPSLRSNAFSVRCLRD